MSGGEAEWPIERDNKFNTQEDPRTGQWAIKKVNLECLHKIEPN